MPDNVRCAAAAAADDDDDSFYNEAKPMRSC